MCVCVCVCVKDLRKVSRDDRASKKKDLNLVSLTLMICLFSDLFLSLDRKP